jgi:hypothetical protein
MNGVLSVGIIWERYPLPRPVHLLPKVNFRMWSFFRFDKFTEKFNLLYRMSIGSDTSRKPERLFPLPLPQIVKAG